MRSLTFRLTLAFLVVSLTSIALVAFFSGRVTSTEFDSFIASQNRENLIAQLTDYYQNNDRDWKGVDRLWRPGGHMGPMGGGPMGGQGNAALADATGIILIGAENERPGKRLTSNDLKQWTPLTYEGQVVGYIQTRSMPMMSAAGAAFLARVNGALRAAAIGASALALILGASLARALTRPLRELTHASRAIAQGDLERRVNIPSQDELGELASAFNQMGHNLARARDLRRQMTADIAHDLRTPLSVILGYAEALRDGVLPPDPETFSLIHSEAMRLQRLIDDLRTLSLAETGELPLNRRPVSPNELVERAVAAHLPRAVANNLTLSARLAPNLSDIQADADRLAQVLGNLLDNAFKHTPAGGQIICHATPEAGRVVFAVEDSGAGIAPDDVPHVFERFYRADKSRTREPESGGSGLGLAIAKSIVEAHGGRIWVNSQLGQGTTFYFELPTEAPPAQ